MLPGWSAYLLANLQIASQHSIDYSKKTKMHINLNVCFL